jgi:hypothetical protein
MRELEHLASQAPEPLTGAEALAVVDQRGGVARLLQQSDQDDRAALYAALGVSATYDPSTRSAELAVAIPRSAKNVSEGGLASRSNSPTHAGRVPCCLIPLTDVLSSSASPRMRGVGEPSAELSDWRIHELGDNLRVFGGACAVTQQPQTACMAPPIDSRSRGSPPRSACCGSGVMRAEGRTVEGDCGAGWRDHI